MTVMFKFIKGTSFLLYLTGAHLRGKLQHGSDVSQQKIKSRPIRT